MKMTLVIVHVIMLESLQMAPPLSLDRSLSGHERLLPSLGKSQRVLAAISRGTFSLLHTTAFVHFFSDFPLDHTLPCMRRIYQLIV